MRNNLALSICSLISVLLFGFHWADEVSRGMEPGTLNAFGGIVILVVWLAGILVFGGRLTGYIISLLGGIFGLGIVILHMSGRGMVGGHVPPNTPGAFFWVFTMIAIACTSSIAGILSAQELWRLRSRNRQV